MAAMDEVDGVLNQLSMIAMPIVARIENSVPMSQNHYGDYMTAISKFVNMLPAHERTAPAHVKKLSVAVGCALIRAGANKHGVMSALRAMGHL